MRLLTRFSRKAGCARAFGRVEDVFPFAYPGLTPWASFYSARYPGWDWVSLRDSVSPW